MPTVRGHLASELNQVRLLVANDTPHWGWVDVRERDRRAATSAQSRIIGGLLTMLFVAFAALAARPPPHLSVESPTLAITLTTAAGAAITLLGVVFLSMGSRQRRLLYRLLGGGLAAAGAVGLGVGEALADAVPAGAPATMLAGAGMVGQVLGIGLVAAALVIERRPTRPLVTFAAVMAAAGLAVPVIPAAGAVAWLVLAGAGWSAGGAGTFRVSGWVAVASLGLGLGQAADAGLPGGEGAWAIAAGVLPLLGALIALLGVLEEMQRYGAARGVEAVKARQHARRLEELAEAARRVGEERRHDVKSALAGIEYAALAMRRYDGVVDAAALEQLELALRAELSLLRRLVGLPGRPVKNEVYACAPVVEAAAAVGRLAGMVIDAECDREATAVGDAAATQEILQNLVDNASVHAAGAPVQIRCSRLTDWVLIEFDDAGPGIPVSEREAVFKRGKDASHPSSAAGSGLGLYIARRLAREQRGHIWAAESSMGGASIRLALPSGPPPSPTAGSPLGETAAGILAKASVGPGGLDMARTKGES